MAAHKNLNQQQFSGTDIWIEGEPFSREEIYQGAGFVERTPQYLLEKHKEKQAKKKQK